MKVSTGPRPPAPGAGRSGDLMPLTPTARDRQLLPAAAEPDRARHARGLRRSARRATALIKGTVCGAACDRSRLVGALGWGRGVLGPDGVLPGVVDIVTGVQVEAVFEGGTRRAAISGPFGAQERDGSAPGAVLPASDTAAAPDPAVTLTVHNAAALPVGVTSHFPFLEADPRLDVDRASTHGMRLEAAAGSSTRFDSGPTVQVGPVSVGGDRIAIGFACLPQTAPKSDFPACGVTGDPNAAAGCCGLAVSFGSCRARDARHRTWPRRWGDRVRPVRGALLRLALLPLGPAGLGRPHGTGCRGRGRQDPKGAT
ncbi:urease subunit beta [Streptomyces sp. NBC_01214]|uniref:urease subunit beta n=1 Tax=Streptomyces sp. NBC_01214 TaxID=2903777 RepID=UPI00224E9321|nr:urease subunit beta [Streptomyces sp. NBC_01214]MCX4807170.1 urease subunit beta [Streptomyces sp. NBC_01214]